MKQRKVPIIGPATKPRASVDYQYPMMAILCSGQKLVDIEQQVPMMVHMQVPYISRITSAIPIQIALDLTKCKLPNIKNVNPKVNRQIIIGNRRPKQSNILPTYGLTMMQGSENIEKMAPIQNSSIYLSLNCVGINGAMMEQDMLDIKTIVKILTTQQSNHGFPSSPSASAILPLTATSSISPSSTLTPSVDVYSVRARATKSFSLFSAYFSIFNRIYRM